MCGQFGQERLVWSRVDDLANRERFGARVNGLFTDEWFSQESMVLSPVSSLVMYEWFGHG